MSRTLALVCVLAIVVFANCSGCQDSLAVSSGDTGNVSPGVLSVEDAATIENIAKIRTRFAAGRTIRVPDYKTKDVNTLLVYTSPISASAISIYNTKANTNLKAMSLLNNGILQPNPPSCSPAELSKKCVPDPMAAIKQQFPGAAALSADSEFVINGGILPGLNKLPVVSTKPTCKVDCSTLVDLANNQNLCTCTNQKTVTFESQSNSCTATNLTDKWFVLQCKCASVCQCREPADYTQVSGSALSVSVRNY